MRLLFTSTHPVTIDLFMRGQLAWIASRGHEVHVVASPGPRLNSISAREHVATHDIPMQREISPVADLRAFGNWIALLWQVRPDVVVVGTPKAALLGGLSAWVLRVPRRVYLMRGARFEGVSGAKGLLLRSAERLTCATAHHVIAVSPSLARLALEARMVPARKLVTVGAGSSNGVDLSRFSPPTMHQRRDARSRWRLGENEVAVAFIGRLHADKGLNVLREALEGFREGSHPPVVLLLAGDADGADLGRSTGGGLDIRYLGEIEDVPDLLHAVDLLVLPTQREGFPNVVLEAAASGLPVVTTDATGAVDSVVDGVTGFSVPKQDGAAFGDRIARLADSSVLRAQMGAAARRRVEESFSSQMVWEGMFREYLGASEIEETERSSHGL